MSHTTKTTDPRDYMGVYKTLPDVPDRYRLRQYADAYADRDVWGEYADNVLFERLQSVQSRRRARRVERRWKDHMADRGRHHALATPNDVEAWFGGLLDNLALETVYAAYYVTVERLFSWLQNHTEHPHVYHPVWMAAADPDAEAAATLWDHKIGATRGGDSS